MMRRSALDKVKRIHQFMRDVEDEKLWIADLLPRATATNYGNSLLSVQLLIKKNHVTCLLVVGYMGSYHIFFPSHELKILMSEHKDRLFWGC